jgi:hypothetical protein
MVPKYKIIIFGALLSASALAFPGASMAGAGAQLNPYIWADASAPNGGFIQVADRGRMRMEWNRDRDGDRCLHRNGDCRHFHGGYYYRTPWWTLPLVVGGGYRDYDDDYYDDGYDLNSQHVEWCLDHYRSYNLRTNTWVSYGGEVHECISPYA